MVVGLQRQLSSGDVMGLISVVFVPQWAGRASVLVIYLCPHLSAKLVTCLPLADPGLLGYAVGTSDIFSICKMLLHPCQPFLHTVMLLQRGHATLMAGHSGHQEALHQVTQRYLWPVVPVDVLSYVQACLACTGLRNRCRGCKVSANPYWHLSSCGLLSQWILVLFSLWPGQSHTSDIGHVYSDLVLCHQKSCLQPCRILHLGYFGSQNVQWYPAVFVLLIISFLGGRKREKG